MPAWTALGAKSSSSLASFSERVSLPVDAVAQPAASMGRRANRRAVRARGDIGARGYGRAGRRISDVRRRVTFSRNLTLSLSRTCVSHCKYCAFQTHQTHLHTPDEVEALLDGAAKRNVKELLVLTGDDPAHHAGGRARRADLGFDDFVAYVVWACERALERGLLPHTNLGAVTRQELVRLREVT